MTVTAPDVAVTTSTSITITGTVTDISAGTQQQAVAANFPNGVPAFQTQARAQWMEYVYMQQPFPANATGVPVTISVIDSNGNLQKHRHYYKQCQAAYSSLNWTPDIPGHYTVVATFAGSESYYSSYSEAAFYANAPGTTEAPTTTQAAGIADTYFAPAVSAIVAVLIIILVMLVVLLFSKRP